MTSPVPCLPFLLSLLAACGGGGRTTEGGDGAAVDAVDPETARATAETLSRSAELKTVVPSPVEAQKALEAAGIDTQLASLIQQRTFDVANPNPDNVAIRTGVVLADMLLTVKGSSKEDLLARVAQVEEGLTRLDGGADILETIDDIEERVRADSVSRDELLHELDILLGASIPELLFNGRERIVPLIQAGAWLEGINLLSKAVRDAGRPEAADALLKQRSVCEYFLKYVREDAKDAAPAAIVEKLEASLLTLRGISETPERLTEEDIESVIRTTDDVMALL